MQLNVVIASIEKNVWAGSLVRFVKFNIGFTASKYFLISCLCHENLKKVEVDNVLVNDI